MQLKSILKDDISIVTSHRLVFALSFGVATALQKTFSQTTLSTTPANSTTCQFMPRLDTGSSQEVSIRASGGSDT